MKKGTVLQIFLLLIMLLLLVGWETSRVYNRPFAERWGVPSGIFTIILDWFRHGEIWHHIWSTLSIAVLGLVLGTMLGISLAYLCYTLPAFGASLTPVMAWLNSLPRILLVPIFIATLGIGVKAKLTMVIAMTVFVFFFNVYNGLNTIDQRLIANARLLGARNAQVLRHVHFPLIGSWLIAGLRIALGFAFIGAIISEYLGASAGLGYVVDLAYGQDRYDRAIAGLLVIFMVVGLLDFMVRRLERIWFRDNRQIGSKEI